MLNAHLSGKALLHYIELDFVKVCAWQCDHAVAAHIVLVGHKCTLAHGAGAWQHNIDRCLQVLLESSQHP